MPLYTIGHSNHSPELFFNLISRFGITHLIDIRSVPYSGRFPFFNRENLKPECEKRGIDYQWWGDKLGGKRTGLNFNDISGTESFKRAIVMLAETYGENSDRAGCLLCAEKDPAQCHRSILIGPAIRKITGGIDLQHILADGTLIPQSILEEEGKAPKSDRSGTLSLFGDQE